MKTSSLVFLPPNKQAITCKQIYKKKPGIYVEAKKFKTRLIARGCEQIIRINFGETFALITKWNTIEAMIVLTRSKGWKAHHLDMKTIFLNKHLHDEIYMPTTTKI
jgi:IS4 transposase